MKSKQLKIGAAITLAGLLLICIWIMAIPCPATLRPWNRPEYIESVWPPATSATMLSCSTKRRFSFEADTEVGVAINTSGIWELELPQSNDEDSPSFSDRVSLYVDGEEVPVTTQIETGGAYFIGDTELELAHWYFLGSNYIVPPGDHLAKVVIATRAGKNLEYEWHFRIK